LLTLNPSFRTANMTSIIYCILLSVSALCKMLRMDSNTAEIKREKIAGLKIFIQKINMLIASQSKSFISKVFTNSHRI